MPPKRRGQPTTTTDHSRCTLRPDSSSTGSSRTLLWPESRWLSPPVPQALPADHIVEWSASLGNRRVRWQAKRLRTRGVADRQRRPQKKVGGNTEQLASAALVVLGIDRSNARSDAM